jgi:hypothetical protein
MLIIARKTTMMNFVLFVTLFFVKANAQESDNDVFSHNRLKQSELNNKLDSAILEEKRNSEKTLNGSFQTSIDTNVKLTTCDSSYEMGRLHAKTFYKSGGWFALGFVSGWYLPIVGTGFIVSLSASSHPSPDTIPPIVQRDCYTRGYEQMARKKRIVGSVLGSIAGACVAVVTVLIIIAANPK